MVRQKVALEGKDKLAVQADVTFVLVSLETGRAVDLDKRIMALLLPGRA